MKALPFIVTETVFIEISQNSLKALNGKAGLEVPLERLENGRLTDRSRERLTQALTGFVKRKKWRHRVRGYCAISARGVSLRRMTLPPSTKEELHRILSEGKLNSSGTRQRIQAIVHVGLEGVETLSYREDDL